MSKILVENISKSFTVNHHKIYALRHINLSIDAGEIVCILGPSGSGKTTLLNIIAGLEVPSKGRVLIDGININHCSKTTLLKMRQKKISFIFQNYCLLSYLSAIENVSLPLMFQRISKNERLDRAKQMLEMVGLSKRLLHSPSQLSGGQQQRVGIARAFVTNPEVVFADEPTGNLDSNNSENILRLIKDVSKSLGITLIIVSHDPMVERFVDRVIEIIDGRVVSDRLN